MTGVLLCRLAHQALKGAPWVGCYSVVQCIRCLMGQLLYCSAANFVMWRERGYGDGPTSYMWLISIHLFPWLPGFPPPAWHFPPSSLSHPLDPSLHSQQQLLPSDCSTIKLQLPAAAPSRRLAFLPSICMAAARTVWFSFHLGCHRAAVSFSALNIYSLTQTIAPLWGSDPCFCSLTHQVQVQSY